MKNLIIPSGNLENITGRLVYLHALLETVCMAMSVDKMSDSLSGVIDLLRSIQNDFEADISAAKEVAT